MVCGNRSQNNNLKEGNNYDNIFNNENEGNKF